LFVSVDTLFQEGVELVDLSLSVVLLVTPYSQNY